MNSNEILKADLLDIVFENRNKQYGAYALRKNYNKRLTIALAVSLTSIFLIFLLINGDAPSGKIFSEKNEGFILRPLDLPEQVPNLPELPQQPRPPSQQTRQELFTTRIRILDDSRVLHTMADQETLMNRAIFDRTLPGIPSVGNISLNHPTSNTSADNLSLIKPDVVPDREPEFPGGYEAWVNFLRTHLVAPAELEVDQKRTVRVRFTVDVDGSVTGFEIVETGGRNFDNEVIRVLKKMPKWRPAVQNGETIAKAFVQPVTFVAVEQ